MITPDYARTHASYNAEMNRRLYAAAAGLADAGRRQDRGAFWRSIHGTLSHLLWADQMWMHRFDGWDRPAVPIAQSGELMADFDAMTAARFTADARLEAWATTLDPAWLAGSETWFSGAIQQQVTRPRPLLVMHIFNHQTHHRGQAHAMLTAAGQGTGATDLWVLAGECRSD